MFCLAFVVVSGGRLNHTLFTPSQSEVNINSVSNIEFIKNKNIDNV